MYGDFFLDYSRGNHFSTRILYNVSEDYACRIARVWSRPPRAEVRVTRADVDITYIRVYAMGKLTHKG